MKTIIILLAVFFSFQWVNAQEERDESVEHKHIVGFDANTLLMQIIPFNTISRNASFPAIVSRRLWNDKGYRVTAGFVIDEQSFEFENLYFSIGYTAQQSLGDNFKWIKGIDLAARGHDDFVSLGLRPYWGIEYQLNKVVSFSTESAIFFGLGDYEFALSILPPVNIQCHFKLK